MTSHPIIVPPVTPQHPAPPSLVVPSTPTRPRRKRRRDVVSSTPTRPRRKRRRDVVFPVLSMGPFSKKPRTFDETKTMYSCSVCSESEVLFVSSCKNHFMCLECMNHSDSVNGYDNKCPLCREPIPSGPSLIKAVMPPIRDLQFAYGENAEVPCPSKCGFASTPSNTIRHFLSECEFSKTNCHRCNTVVTRKDLENHPCRSVVCSHDCNFRLYENKDHELNLHHATMHQHVKSLNSHFRKYRINSIESYDFPAPIDDTQQLLHDILINTFENLSDSYATFRDQILESHSPVPDFNFTFSEIKKAIINLGTIFDMVIEVDDTHRTNRQQNLESYSEEIIEIE